MRQGPFAAVALAVALLIPAPLAAKTARFPENGDAAFVIDVPAAWTREDRIEDGVLLFTTPEKDITISFFVSDDSGASSDQPIDEAMTKLGVNHLRNKAFKVISGHVGSEYESDGTNKDGVHARVHIEAVGFPGNRIGIKILAIADIADPASAAEAQAIYHSVTITERSSWP